MSFSTLTGVNVFFGGFNPDNYGTTLAILDAGLGVTLNGSDVSSHADQSSEGNDVTQATASKQPLYNSSDSNFNNQPSFTFDGSSEYLSRATLASGAASQPNTVISVYKLANTTGFHAMHDGVGSGNRHNAESDGTNLSLNAGSGAYADSVDTSAHIQLVEYNNTSSKVWIDGVAGSTVSIGTNALNGLAIGVNLNLNGAYFAGEIAYTLIYAGLLSTANKNSVGNGLATKLGLSWSDI